MKVAIDAVGIRGEGGAAVLCELLHWLPEVRPEWRWHVFLLDRVFRRFDDPVVCDRVVLERVRQGNAQWERLTWVNRHLPARLQHIGADALFAFANIAPSRPVVPQVVLCHQPNAFFSDGLPPWSVTLRLKMRFMRKHILRGALASEAVLVQTNAMRVRMEQIEPRLREKVHVVPSGYRTLPPDGVVGQEVRSKVMLSTRPRLIYVTHPGIHKNHLTLIRALRHISESQAAVSLLLTLDPSCDRAPYVRAVRRIKAEAERAGVADHVVWLGILSPDEVDFALRESDLLVFPSLAESFGLGLVEAMAAGCPIAASDLPYAHDVAGDAAVYFDPKDPRSIADVVLATLQDRPRLGHLRCAADARRPKFSYGSIARRVAGILELGSPVGHIAPLQLP